MGEESSQCRGQWEKGHPSVGANGRRVIPAQGPMGEGQCRGLWEKGSAGANGRRVIPAQGPMGEGQCRG